MTQPSLPRFTSRTEHEQAVLDASRTVVGLFVRSRSSAFSVRDLAEHARVAERTFYRWFPRKEDAIRPYLEAGLAHVLTRVREAPRDRPLGDALVDAHREVLDLALQADGEALLHVVNETERLRAVWLQVLTDAETAFAAVIAERLGLDADSVQARFLAASVVAAGRLALQSLATGASRAPGTVFAECLELLGPALRAVSESVPEPR